MVLVIAAGVAAFIGFGGHDGGRPGTAANAQAPDSQSPAARAGSPPLGNLPAGRGAVEFAFNPRTPSTVYVAAMGNSRGYVYKTTDSGRHWQSTATTGGGWTRADTLAADPRHPGTLYAGNVVAVYKTVDSGRSWRPWKRGLFPKPGEISRTRGSPNYHFGTPGTTSWNRGEGWVSDIAVDPADSSIVYSATDAVRKSTNGGHTWKTVFRPAGSAVGFGVARIAIAPTRPETIYAMSNGGTGSRSIYKSTDAGATWHPTAASTLDNSDSWATALAVDLQQPTTVYAAIGQTVVKTTNAGANWQPILHSRPEQVISSLAVDPQQPDTVYAGVYSGRRHTGGIYKTTDGGRTWHLAVSTVALYTVSVNPSRPTTIYAAGWAGRDAKYGNSFGLLRSTNRGLTWTTAR